MSVNRGLLELAAMAAGIDGVYESWCYMGFNEGIRLASKAYRPWNPLTDDGDALRLAVKLRIVVNFDNVSAHVPASVTARFPSKHPTKRSWVLVEYVPDAMWSSGYEPDARFANYKMEEPGAVRGLESATRRAITRAAAAIGSRAVAAKTGEPDHG